MASVIENNSMSSDLVIVDSMTAETGQDLDQIDLIDKLTLEENGNNDVSVVSTAVAVPLVEAQKNGKNGSEENLLVTLDAKQRKKLDKLVGL